MSVNRNLAKQDYVIASNSSKPILELVRNETDLMDEIMEDEFVDANDKGALIYNFLVQKIGKLIFPIVSICLKSLSVYDLILEGIKIKYKSRHKECIHCDLKPLSVSYGKYKSTIQKYSDYKTKFECTCPTEHCFDEQAIESRYLPQTTRINVTNFILKLFTWCAILTHFVNILMYSDLGVMYPWIDCMFAGRLIQRASMGSTTKFDTDFYASFLLFQTFVFRITEHWLKKSIHYDCCGFVACSKKYVIKELLSRRVASSDIVSLLIENPKRAEVEIRQMINQDYDPAFYIPTSYGLILKLNRNIEAWKYLNKFIVLGTSVLISYSPLLFGFFISIILISSDENFEKFSYPHCYLWLNSMEVSKQRISEIKIDWKSTSATHFASIMNIYHALGNATFLLGVLIVQAIVTLFVQGIIILIVLDCRMYSRAIKKELFELNSALGQSYNLKQKPSYHQLAFILDSLYFQIKAYFNNIKGYTDILAYILPSLFITVALLIVPLLVVRILIQKEGSLEAYVHIFSIGVQALIALIFMNSLRNESLDIYKLIFSLLPKLDCSQREHLLKIFRFYKPKPLHCIIFNEDEMSLMYGIKVSL